MKEPNDDQETTKDLDSNNNVESHNVQVQHQSDPLLLDDDPLHPDDPHKKRTWEESFALLQAYQKKHGHCQVPIRFEQDQRLGRWVYSQRVRRDKLTADQIRRLEELGFVHGDEQQQEHDVVVAAVDRDENDQGKPTTTATTNKNSNGPSHELEEDSQEDSQEEEGGSSSAPADDDDIEGFTHTGRRRKAVKRYGITDNDDESDIARRKKEQQQQKKHHKASSSTLSAAVPQNARKVPALASPAPRATPPPPIEEEDEEEEDEEVEEEAEDPDYDSAEERKAREKRRKQRQKEEQAAAAAAATTTNKRGRPKGRPRGRPRKETLQEKLEQIKVGSRVAVLWPAENEFYRATVAKVVPTRKRPYYLEYDDGETEWIDFATGQTEFLVLSPRNGPRKRNRSKASKSSSAVAHSSNAHAYAPNTPPPARSTSPKTTAASSSASRHHSQHHRSSNSNSPQNVPPRREVKVGQRVSVYWSDDEQYYEATVVKQRKDRNHPQPYKLEYEDGEYEWIDLHQVKFRFLDIGDDSVVSPVRKSGRRRRLPSRIRETDEIVEDDSSDDDDDSDDDEEELEDEEDNPTRTTRVKVFNEDDDDDDVDKRTRSRRDNEDDDLEDSSSSDSDSSSSSSTGDEDSDIELISDVKQVHVGARVAVYWSDEERYFEGTVTDHRRGHPRPFFMQYDDGDTQWLDLRTRNFCVLKKVQRRKERRPRGRKKARRGSGSSASSAAERPRRTSVGGRFTLCRQGNGRKAASNIGRAKCFSPTPTETSDTTDDEREKRISALAVPHPMKEIELSTRVAVFCPAKGKFMDGTITHRQIPRNSRKKPCYYVEYDKGHREWIELPKRKVRILKDTGAPVAPKPQIVKRGRKRKPHDSPLLRMLREKEARKANSANLALEDDDDEEMEDAEPEKLAAVPEVDKKLETSDSDSSSDSDDISNATSEDESSDHEDAEAEAELKKPLVAAQIGIGTRIAVQCPLELKFMEGTVTRLIRNRRKPFYVEYDIGGCEWIDVHTSTVKLLTEEEEKLLKEQSAIVVKEEVEEALPVVHNLICDFSDDDDDSDKDMMDSDAEASSRKAKTAPKLTECNQVGNNNSAKKIPDVQMADATTTSKAAAVDLMQKLPSGNKKDASEYGMPQLQDEDVVPVFASAPQKASSAQIIPTRNNSKPSAASEPIVDASRVDIPRVSDSEGASVSEKDCSKDSPTGVACVLGTASSGKICKGVVSGTSLTIPEMKQATKSSSNLAEASVNPKTAAISTTTNNSSVDLVRVAPVAIVSETSTDDRRRDGDVIALNGNADKIVPVESVRRVSSQASDNEGASQRALHAEDHLSGAQAEQSKVVDHDTSSKEIDPEAEIMVVNGQHAKPKRGRPPRNRPVSSMADKRKDTSEKSSTATQAEEIDINSPLPHKRGPGRQPKSSSRKESWDAHSEASGSSATGIASDLHDGVSKKRGPGRPSKKSPPPPPPSSSKPDRSVTNGSHEGSGAKHESKAHAPLLKKRGPGRPPKRKHVVTIDSDEEKNMDPPDEPPRKRGPGRPPKQPKSEPPEDNTPKKRGPGRPRKQSFSEATSEDVPHQETPAKKRGPGRPRKSEGQEHKKRGPGRPRKTPTKDEGDDESSIERNVFNVTTVNGSRCRKEPNRFSPTNFGDSDSDSSTDTEAAKGKRGSTPFKKSEFGAEHRQKANQIEVGMRVSVYWGGDQAYYPGTVTKERSYRKKRFFLEYDDGESEWMDFHRNKFHILTPPKNGGKKRKLGVGEVEIPSDEEDKPRRKSTDSETDPSTLIRNRMDMADVMLRIKVGSRVEVFWSDDDCFYPGTITKQRENIIQAKKPFFLEYDDGESEWIDLSDHVFRVIAVNDTATAPDGVASSEVIAPAGASKDKKKKEKETDESAIKKQKRAKTMNF